MDIKLREEIYQLHAEMCGALADTNRILILYTLAERPYNVTDLAESLGMPQPTASRHLKVLRDRGMATARREGQSVYYALSDPRIIEALDLLRDVLGELLEIRVALTRNMHEETPIAQR